MAFSSALSSTRTSNLSSFARSSSSLARVFSVTLARFGFAFFARRFVGTDEQ
jgi:hypothetical protein